MASMSYFLSSELAFAGQQLLLVPSDPPSCPLTPLLASFIPPQPGPLCFVCVVVCGGRASACGWTLLVRVGVGGRGGQPELWTAVDFTSNDHFAYMQLCAKNMYNHLAVFWRDRT